MIEIQTPVGRLIAGHPMIEHAVVDKKTNIPKLNKDNSPRMEAYFGLAIPKAGEQHWNQTAWGLEIWNKAALDWPNGGSGAADFAWKISDGDSTATPSARSKNKTPLCQREGYAGHWILNLSQGWAAKCFHAGMFEPHQQIQNSKEIKTGDYARAVIQVRGNGIDSESPGMYLNPRLFELTRAGILIVTESGPSAADSFGGAAGVLPQGALVDPNVVQPVAQPQPVVQPVAQPQPVVQPVAQPQPVVQPVAQPQPTPQPTPQPVSAAPVVKYQTPEGQFTEAELVGFGFTPEAIALLPQIAGAVQPQPNFLNGPAV